MRFRKDMKIGAGLVRLADGSLLSVADLPQLSPASRYALSWLATDRGEAGLLNID